MLTKTSRRKTLTFFRRPTKPFNHIATSYTPRATIHSFTTYDELRTTYYAPLSNRPLPTPHIPQPTPCVIPDERRKPRDLGSRPSHRPVMGVLRIDSPTGHMTRRCITSSSDQLLTSQPAHYAFSSGFQLARASGPLGWNDEGKGIRATPAWSEKKKGSLGCNDEGGDFG